MFSVQFTICAEESQCGSAVAGSFGQDSASLHLRSEINTAVKLQFLNQQQQNVRVHLQNATERDTERPKRQVQNVFKVMLNDHKETQNDSTRCNIKRCQR